ncbi:MAG: prepilin-type N-terminal cleavage/methylation domain-containing protein [Planctomycetes bacterium]|nr:prepilin-type N-terminal cleavage/methylation domain-containing protein [Planctomycetota bacterium]
MNKRREGFTLIELMIVVAIIAIIAAIAIPSLLAARISGNEASAISSLRTMSTVGEQYRTRFGSYATTLADMQTAGYIDNVLGSGSKSGYDFTFTGGATTWSCTADPSIAGRTGERGFFADESGVIRFVTSGTASATSSPVD